MTDRLRTAVTDFLDACSVNAMAFEPQRAFATSAEATEAAHEFWARYCELHRAIGREPPTWPPNLSGSKGSLI